MTTESTPPSPAADAVGADPFRLIEEAAVDLARRACDLLLTYFRQDLAVEFKDEERTDPVTAADRAVQQLVFDTVRQRFPGHGVLGEEDGEADATGEFIWVVDPLDGTKNFTCGMPIFAVSIAVLFRGAPVVAAIAIPGPANLGGGVYHARYGNGAYRDGVRLVATTLPQPDPARLVALPASASRQFTFDDRLARRPGEVRSLGSIVYELALIADGGLQYALFRQPQTWDVAAGILLVREAGGEVYEWRRAWWGLRSGWRPFRQFEPMPRAERKPGAPRQATPSLRNWQRPLLVGGAAIADYVREYVRPREPRLRWLRRLVAPIRSRARRSPNQDA